MNNYKIGKNDKYFNNNVIYMPDSLSNIEYIDDGKGYSYVPLKKYKSDEEKKIDWLCDGELFSDDIYDISNKCKNTKVVLKMLPIGGVRSGNKIKVSNKFIVVHETSVGLNEAPLYKNKYYYTYKIRRNNYKSSSVGFHFLCDEDEIICFIPWDEIAFHSGSKKINYTSIGIERLVKKGINFPDALHNQAKLVATLMYMENIPLRRVMTHLNATYIGSVPAASFKFLEGDFIGYDENMKPIRLKECPARMLNYQYGGFDAFKMEIVNCLRKKDLFIDELNQLGAMIDKKRSVEDKKMSLIKLRNFIMDEFNKKRIGKKKVICSR